jgi:hypothetical protein
MKAKTSIITLILAAATLVLTACDSGSNNTPNWNRQAEQMCEMQFQRNTQQYQDCINNFNNRNNFNRFNQRFFHVWRAENLSPSTNEEKESLEILFREAGMCLEDNFFFGLGECSDLANSFTIELQTESLESNTFARALIVPANVNFWDGGNTHQPVIIEGNLQSRFGGAELTLNRSGVIVSIKSDRLVEGRVDLGLSFNGEIASGSSYYRSMDNMMNQFGSFNDPFFNDPYNNPYCDPRWDLYCW